MGRAPNLFSNWRPFDGGDPDGGGCRKGTPDRGSRSAGWTTVEFLWVPVSKVAADVGRLRFGRFLGMSPGGDYSQYPH